METNDLSKEGSYNLRFHAEHVGYTNGITRDFIVQVIESNCELVDISYKVGSGSISFGAFNAACSSPPSIQIIEFELNGAKETYSVGSTSRTYPSGFASGIEGFITFDPTIS